MAPYQYMDHTSEVGIAAQGATLGDAFASAAEALAAMLCDPQTVGEEEELPLQVFSPDLAALLVDWLNEINYHFEVHRFAFRRFLVQEISDRHLRATGLGERLDLSRHRVGEGVKAATYHALEVRQEEEGYRLQVTLDI